MARVEALQAELVAEQQRSGGHRADYERERARVDQLLSELLTATADLMRAEVTGRLEGELAALRSPRPSSVPTVAQARPRSWWRAFG